MFTPGIRFEVAQDMFGVPIAHWADIGGRCVTGQVGGAVGAMAEARGGTTWCERCLAGPGS